METSDDDRMYFGFSLCCFQISHCGSIEEMCFGYTTVIERH